MTCFALLRFDVALELPTEAGTAPWEDCGALNFDVLVQHGKEGISVWELENPPDSSLPILSFLHVCGRGFLSLLRPSGAMLIYVVFRSSVRPFVRPSVRSLRKCVTKTSTVTPILYCAIRKRS